MQKKSGVSLQSLRPVTSEDLPNILTIEKLVYPYPWSEEHFRAEMEKPHAKFYVLTDDETDSVVSGYVVFWLAGDFGHLLNVAVHPEFRRQGLGERLVRRVIDEALREGVEKVVLEVRKGSLPAIALYQKVGFRILRIQKSFYQNGEDAYVMELPLSRSESPSADESEETPERVLH
jgi:ribosomal-protein-alanine N-acetyltransferase